MQNIYTTIQRKTQDPLPSFKHSLFPLQKVTWEVEARAKDDSSHALACHSSMLSLRKSWSKIQTLKPQYQNTYSPHCHPYISYDTSWENLFEDQDISSLLITYFILKASMLDKAVIL